MNNTCRLCGACCCRYLTLPLAPESTFDAEAKRWLELHGITIGNGKLIIPLRCSKLLNGVCTIYETRPKVCRDFAVDGEACQQARRAFAAP